MSRLQYGMTAEVEISETFAEGRVALPIKAQGYDFPWGQIVERTSGLLIVFDFYLSGLQAEFNRRDIRTCEMQERVFSLLEELSDLTVRDNAVDPMSLSVRRDNWKIIPGVLGRCGAFTILGHAGHGKDLREWLVGEFILDILPQIHERMYVELAA